MGYQTILVAILFLAALFYVGRMIYSAIFKKNPGCASNCKCGVDFSNIPEPKKPA